MAMEMGMDVIVHPSFRFGEQTPSLEIGPHHGFLLGILTVQYGAISISHETERIPDWSSITLRVSGTARRATTLSIR